MDEKRKEKLAKKLHESTRALQSKAAETDAALTAAEERAKQDAKKRTFANPKTADEADGELPTLEQLANGGTLLRSNSGKWKTREEILKDGTLIEKLRLYFSSGDLDGYFGTKGKLTKAEIAKIAASIRTREDKVLVKKCYTEYHALLAYAQKMQYVFKRFQVAYSMLAMLLNKLESYEHTAKQLTTLYGFMQSATFSISKEGETMLEREKWANLYSKEYLEQWVNENVRLHPFDGAALHFDESKKRFWVDVELEPKKDGIFFEILKEAQSAKSELSDFKAYAAVAEEYIAASTLHFMPSIIQMTIENAEEERYTRYLVKNLSYFRSELNRRKEEGETITPEEEKRAVIPDYYEVEPSKDMYKSCKALMKSLTS